MDMLAYRNAPRRQETWMCKHYSSSLARNIVEKQGSYIKLPNDYPRISCSGREMDVSDELNNNWISVVTGSEDFSFKVMRKNQYEEQLFNCEDERFELDMTLNMYTAAIETLENIQREVIAARNEGREYIIQKSLFSSVKFKAIYEVYGDVAEGMLSNFCVQPLRTSEFILKRLKRNKNGCQQQKERNKEFWKDLCEQNFYKSLDHKSFYFRQSEKKNISTKGIVN